MSTRMGRAKRIRPEPLPKPCPIYGYDKYPDSFRVSFADGRTKVYETPIEQPKPTFFSDSEIRRMSKNPDGYQFRFKASTRRGWFKKLWGKHEGSVTNDP